MAAVPEAPRALDATTLCGAFQATVAARGDNVALRTPGGAQELTWTQYGDRVRELAAGFSALGVGRGDSFALMLVNRPEFHLADTAAMHLGATCFSIYNTLAPEQVAFILEDAGPRIVVTERQFVPVIEAARAHGGNVQTIVVVDGDEGAGELTLDGVAAQGGAAFDLDAAWQELQAEDLLCLIYTSGTTGPPKGVQITHANYLAQARALQAIVPQEGGGRMVSYLPMAHVAERNSTHYWAITMGNTVTCVAELAHVIPSLPEVRPTTFVAVPRVWEKLKAALEAGFAAEPDKQRREAVEWALAVSREKVRVEQKGGLVDATLSAQVRSADEQVLCQIRERLGLDQVRWCIVGAAPTPVEVMEFYFSLGLPLLEVWGLSETTAVATINPPQRPKIGTVGLPLPGVEVRLAESDDEVLVRGPIVMAGYRNQPQKTAEVIDADGWFATGDVGEFDADGYLKIVDRKKELIINAGGKNMSPANIEAHIKSASPVIGQAVAIGDGRPYNVALIVLDPDVAPVFAREHGGRSAGSLAELATDTVVLNEVAAGIARANEHLARVEQIKRFAVLSTDWEAGGDELTPTMKLKRKPIAEKYAAEIERLYAGDG